MNKENELVSIILPSYNAELYLSDSINSILKQSYKNIELVLIDDGSTDKSLEIAERIAISDKRLKVYARGHNGLIDTLNYGIDKSKGAFIARMDADDISHPKRIECQLDLIRKERADIVGCNYLLIDEKSIIRRRYKVPIRHEDILVRLTTSVPFCHGSIMTKSGLLKDYRYGSGNYKAVEDYSLWTSMAVDGVKFANCSEQLYYLRENTKSLTISKGSLVPKSRLCVALNYIIRSQDPLISLCNGANMRRILTGTDFYLSGDYIHLLKILYRYHSKSRPYTLLVNITLYLKYICYVLYVIIDVVRNNALQKRI